VTWLANLLTNPQLQQAGYRLMPAVNDVIRRADLPSIDEILPDENQQTQQPGMMQSNQAPMQQSGGAMVPIQMPQQQMGMK
jgi:hypothetical protein